MLLGGEDRLTAVADVCDDGNIGAGAQQHAQALAHQVVVICKDDANGVLVVRASAARKPAHGREPLAASSSRSLGACIRRLLSATPPGLAPESTRKRLCVH
ncbi:MAG: hypothetical protein Kow0010_01870 [Dehalococcoidia bacterium]